MFGFIMKKRTIQDLQEYSTSGKFKVGEKRSQIHIAVIDDEQLTYIETLRMQHFSITHFTDISDIRTIEAFDIILCDIKGVGKAFKTKYEGAFLISEIKKYYPFKYIMLYSGQLFDTSYNAYWKMADNVIKKDIDSEEWVEFLDLAITRVIDPVYQWKKIRDFLLDENTPITTISDLEDIFVKGVLKEKSFYPNKYLASLSTNAQNVITSFVGSVIFKLIMGG